MRSEWIRVTFSIYIVFWFLFLYEIQNHPFYLPCYYLLFSLHFIGYPYMTIRWGHIFIVLTLGAFRCEKIPKDYDHFNVFAKSGTMFTVWYEVFATEIIPSDQFTRHIHFDTIKFTFSHHYKKWILSLHSFLFEFLIDWEYGNN